MSLARLARWMLPGSLLLACGERAGDAVVALPGAVAERPGGGGDAGTPATDGTAGGAAGAPSEEPTPGPSGLCAACVTSRECGAVTDACVAHEDERFCGRFCEAPRDCPDGYSCVELSNSQLWQCVPDQRCPTPQEPAPALSEVRDYVLARVNSERFAQAGAPLQSSSCLDELAQQSAVDFARTDVLLGKFADDCAPVWPDCACGWRAQAELTIARYGLDWQTAVDLALTASIDEATERFSLAYLAPTVSDVGIGFWLSGDEAWLALSFR
jgi:hypothetical protein